MRQTKAEPAELLSDEELLPRALARDQAAVRVMTQRHNRRLYRVARSILRNDSEAEDVVQETYVRAFTALERFRGDSLFATWLTRIAMNEALGRLRRRRTTVEWDTSEEKGSQAEIIPFPASSDRSDPERTMAQREIRELLERAIDSLPDVFRTVFVARIVEGMNIEDTAELLGVQPATVKTRLHRARLLLRQQLDKELGPILTDAFPFDGLRCARLTQTVLRRLGLSPDDAA